MAIAKISTPHSDACPELPLTVEDLTTTIE